MTAKATTLSRFLIEDQLRFPEHGIELGRVIGQLAYASKIIARELARAPLIGMLGLVGDVNATGDAQKKLDVFSNTTVIDAMVRSGLVSAIVSEELEQVKHLSGDNEAKFVLMTDPLDGSSNIDLNRAVGTIFGLYQRVSKGRDSTEADVLRKGSELVAAGYVVYGTSTLLVYCRGHGVNGFTLDPELGEFLLSHPNLRCPPRGRSYSANLGHYHEWSAEVQKYVDYLTAHDPGTRRPYSLRYSGALVADFHGCLLQGGIYFYPPDAEHNEGKLRLTYECAPLAFVAEQAGAQASNGSQRILDLKAASIHQRTPIAIGSAEEVALYNNFLRSGSG